MSDEVDVRPEVVTPSSVSIPVGEFEGSFVRQMDGSLPAITLPMDVGYKRGTHLLLGLEVRVRNVNFKEDKKGDLSRVHTFALEEAVIYRAWDPVVEVTNVGGDAAGDAWQGPLLAWLRGEADVLDFEGEEIPERLQDLLEAAALQGRGAPSIPAEDEGVGF